MEKKQQSSVTKASTRTCNAAAFNTRSEKNMRQTKRLHVIPDSISANPHLTFGNIIPQQMRTD